MTPDKLIPPWLFNWITEPPPLPVRVLPVFWVIVPATVVKVSAPLVILLFKIMPPLDDVLLLLSDTLFVPAFNALLTVRDPVLDVVVLAVTLTALFAVIAPRVIPFTVFSVKPPKGLSVLPPVTVLKLLDWVERVAPPGAFKVVVPLETMVPAVCEIFPEAAVKVRFFKVKPVLSTTAFCDEEKPVLLLIRLTELLD